MDINLQEAKKEYLHAMRMGQKQVRELASNGKNVNPYVLDDILEDRSSNSIQEVGFVEIPADRVIGIASSGRTSAFSADFLPLLEVESEFAGKWINLCAIHLSDSGLRDPIGCFEYMGNFYVQEGNKRTSVLKYFGSPKIPAIVRRILPKPSDDPRVIAYYEFLEFYKATHIYDVQFCQPGQYATLLAFLGKEIGEEWTERECKTFSSYFQYFKEAYLSLKGANLDLLPEEVLLLWLQIHHFSEIGKISSEELKKTLLELWNDVVSLADQAPMQVRMEPSKDVKVGIWSKIIPQKQEKLVVAFIYPRDPKRSPWVRGHDKGRKHLEEVFPNEVVVHTYCNADTIEQAEKILDKAVSNGAQVVFTTTPQLSRATLKAAVKYPKVRFLNCSADAPYLSVRSYYCRIFEGKFITGAIAGAMADDDYIGYVGSYPIYGVTASINAFALGAQMTNPRAKIKLGWSCIKGNPVGDFITSGIKVISNRDIPTPNKKYLELGEYGAYYINKDEYIPLGSPCWMWGKFYENVVHSILSGGWEPEKNSPRPINYWWGMDSGVIDVQLSDKIPDGLLCLANILRDGIKNGTIDPFKRKIIAQDGRIINDGNRTLTPDEILHIDWLCENIEGKIPEFNEIEAYSKAMVRELGIYRDTIPKEKEGTI